MPNCQSDPRVPAVLTATRSGRAVRYVLGLMAGTSADGVDAAIIQVAGKGERMRVRFVHHHHQAFPPALRKRLLAVMAPSACTTQEIARLHGDLGEVFARVARAAAGEVSRAARPSLIGLSGQTVCHLPGRSGDPTVTLQLGNAAVVADRCGLPVVFDFRQSDVAAGGQGAPLVPWTDYVLLRQANVSRVVQNIGGIANVTWLPAGCTAGEVLAFDTGPGNMIIDALAERISGGRRRMDRDGRLAARGRVLEEVLTAWMAHPFFRRKPPKTTGRETFGCSFVDGQLDLLRSASPAPEDWLATATAFTARTIAQGYRRFISRWPLPDRARSQRRPPKPASGDSSLQVVLAGGGSRNRTLVRLLQAEIPQARLVTIDELGIPAEAKEAVSFAVLAAARMDDAPSNLPAATGARSRVSLGCLCL